MMTAFPVKVKHRLNPYLIKYFSCKNEPHLSQKSCILRCTSVNLRIYCS